MSNQRLNGLQEIAINKLTKGLNALNKVLQGQRKIEFVGNTAIVFLNMYDMQFQDSLHTEFGNELYVYLVSECGDFKRVML